MSLCASFASLRMTLKMNDEFKTLKKFRRRRRPGRIFVFAPSAGGTGNRENLSVASQHLHRAGIGAAQLRRTKSPAQRCRSAGELEREIPCERGDSVRRRSHRSAGFHRRAAGGRPRGDAQRGKTSWVAIRKSLSRSCRLIWWSITRCRWISLVPRERWS